MTERAQHGFSKRLAGVSAGYSALVRGAARGMLVFACFGVLTMMLVTCADVILRMFGSPLKGALDVVKIASAVTIAGALPYTTAVKGHVAIEFFFLKLPRLGRVVVDTVSRLLGMALFAGLCWRSALYGLDMHANNRVSDTLQIPLFWTPLFIALACGLCVLVVFHNLIHPGEETMKP